MTFLSRIHASYSPPIHFTTIFALPTLHFSLHTRLRRLCLRFRSNDTHSFLPSLDWWKWWSDRRIRYTCPHSFLCWWCCLGVWISYMSITSSQCCRWFSLRKWVHSKNLKKIKHMIFHSSFSTCRQAVCILYVAVVDSYAYPDCTFLTMNGCFSVMQVFFLYE